MVYSIGCLLELAYLSDDVWYLTNIQQQKEKESISLYCSTFFWEPSPESLVISSVRYLELCPILAFQWAIGNANSKEILNSQSGKQLALGHPAHKKQVLDDFIHVFLAAKVGAQNLVAEQEAFSSCHWSVLDSHPRSLIPHPSLLRLQAEMARWKPPQLANIRW